MRRGGLYAIGLAGLLLAGVLAWRAWPHSSAGSFDPVNAVIGTAGLLVGVASLFLAVRAQGQADIDVAAAAARLAVAIEQEEATARQQLLGGGDRTIDVPLVFQPAPGHDAAGAAGTGTLEQIVGYYRKLRPQRMVISGAAGSGKTVLAIELMLGLLKDRSADAPVPVLMSAASLDTNRPTRSAVTEWITEHLIQTYKTPKAAARQLVAARMVLPVLDGLDEMDPAEAPAYDSRAGQMIRACNAYVDGQDKAAIVLTCRFSQYEALEQAREWVRDAARIQICPVAVSTAHRFLAARVTDESRWQAVVDKMEQPGNAPLAQAMSTPWRLTVAAAVYDQRDPVTGSYLRNPTDLTDQGMDTEEKIRDHLLGLYISAAIAEYDSPYPADRVQHWLAVLARYLHANTASRTRAAPVIAGRPLSGTDLVLHELWPLAGYRLPRIITTGMALVIGLSLIVFQLLFISTWSRLEVGIVILTVIFTIIAALASWRAWPDPNLINLKKLKTSSVLRSYAVWFMVGLVTWLVLGLVAWLAFGISSRFVLGLLAALVVGLAVGLVAGGHIDTSEYSAAEPREIVRNDLMIWLVFGLVAGLVFGLVAGLVFGPAAGAAAGAAVGLGAGLGAGLAVELAGGLAGLRYTAFLFCARRWTVHWLPWRLGKFTHWCYRAGLFRIAGISYQFRHKELLDYLIRDSANFYSKPDRVQSTPGGPANP